jgi:pSer/pThr/pTyr-binding forkhead associated (FHA) protein
MLDQHPPLRLQLRNSRTFDKSWTFDLSDNAVIYLGRQGTDEELVVDLTPFGALESGVSRLHALITREQDGYYVMDLESLNETLLNGARLHPGQNYRLRDGDQLHLGWLELLVLL